MSEDERIHRQVDAEIEALEALKPKVIWGFAIYWILLAIGFVLWIMLYLVPTVKGWF